MNLRKGGYIMEKKNHWLFFVLFIFSASLVMLMMEKGMSNPLGIVELFIKVDVDQSDNITRTFTATNVGGTVWGSKDDGYPVTNDFEGGSIAITGNEAGLGFSFVGIGPTRSPTLAYGLYKISFGGVWFKIDYRNCDYCGGCATYPNGDDSADINIVYDPIQNKFFWNHNSQLTDITGQTNDMEFFKDLQDNQSCFSTPPAAPQNLVLVNAGQFGASPQLS